MARRKVSQDGEGGSRPSSPEPRSGLPAQSGAARRGARSVPPARRLAAMPLTALDAVIVMDATGAVVEFNPAAERTFGYSRDEALRRELAELIVPPALRARHRAGLSAYLSTGAGSFLGRRSEVTALRADGSLFPAELTITILPGDGPPLFTGYVRDISARHEAEQALHDSEERLRTMVASAPIVLFAVDPQGVFTLSEGKGLALLGIKPGEHVGRSYFDLYAGLPDSVAAMRRALAGETTTTIDHYKGLVFETRWTATRAPDGSVAGVIGVSADVTERIELEEQRQRLERRTHDALQALLAMARSLVEPDDQTPSPSEVAHPRTVTVATRLADLTRDVLGCERVSVTAIDEKTGVQTPLALVGATPELDELWWRTTTATNIFDPGADAAMISRLLAGHSVLLDFTKPPLRDAPNPFGLSSVLVAPMHVNNHFVGVLALDHRGAAHDFTADELGLAAGVSTLAGIVIERDRLLREREEARGNAAALREANRRMDEFLSMVSHEMRTPLTTIVGSTQLAQRRVRRLAESATLQDAAVTRVLSEAYTLLDRAAGQLDRLTRLVDDILDISRIQAGRLEIRSRRANLAAILREGVGAQDGVMGERRIDLELPGDAEVLVDADADRIIQVVTNYLTNALKYSPPEQPITAGLSVADGEARVWVADRGPGIPPAEQEQIWERFYRVKGIEPHHGSSVGLGMGLFISRTIVEQHGGHTGVESTPGLGAIFWFTLPLAPAR